jgi:hypothetical protein
VRAYRLTLPLALAALLAALALAPAGRGANGLEGVSVAVNHPRIATKLGTKFSFRSTVTNTTAQPVSGLIAHLNVLSLRRGTYVDPEDWSSNRTRYLETIPAGGSTDVAWPMQAVNDGEFAVYVAVVNANGASRPPITSPTVHLAVARRRSLNAGGVLPLAFGVPAAVGLLAFGVRTYRRRESGA